MLFKKTQSNKQILLSHQSLTRNQKTNNHKHMFRKQNPLEVFTNFQHNHHSKLIKMLQKHFIHLKSIFHYSTSQKTFALNFLFPSKIPHKRKHFHVTFLNMQSVYVSFLFCIFCCFHHFVSFFKECQGKKGIKLFFCLRKDFSLALTKNSSNIQHYLSFSASSRKRVYAESWVFAYTKKDCANEKCISSSSGERQQEWKSWKKEEKVKDHLQFYFIYSSNP